MQRATALILGTAVLVAAIVIAFLLLSPGGGGPTASASPSASASASASAAAGGDRWTVLYAGTDLNERRESEGHVPNTDAIMLVSLSPDRSVLTLVSLPRDTVDLPLPDGRTYEQKINALYADEGIEALVGAMETLFGVPIDAHVVLDMDDFASLVDAVDGVEVSPEEPLVDPIVDLDLQPGTQTLDAGQALGYVRSRVDEDYGRMARQQEVLVELVRRLVDPEAGRDLASLIEGLDSLETDLPLDELDTLLELARAATEAQVEEVLIEPPLITFEGDRGDGRGYILEADVEAVRSEVQGLIGDE